MSKKITGETRIQINQFLWPTCKECGGKCKSEEVIKFCRDSQPGICKEEVIHIMVQAMREELSRRYKQGEMCTFKIYAEASLNALLERSK